MLVEETLKVSDPNDVIEVVTKTCKEDVIKFISSYNPLIETATKKKQEILQSEPAAQQEQKMKDFMKFY